MSKNEGRYVTAIFCDDIRNEVGGKVSYMGCYGSEIIVEKAPTILPKLCVFASVFTEKNRAFKSLTIRIVQDDEVELARIEVPKEGIKEHSKIFDKTATRKCIDTAIMFSPFVVEKPSILRIMAITEEGEITGPRIMFKVSGKQEPVAEITQERAVQPVKKSKTATPRTIK